MTDCLFCKIRDGEIPSEIVYENEHVLAFNDINPVSKIHVLHNYLEFQSQFLYYGSSSFQLELIKMFIIHWIRLGMNKQVESWMEEDTLTVFIKQLKQKKM